MELKPDRTLKKLVISHNPHSDTVKTRLGNFLTVENGLKNLGNLLYLCKELKGSLWCTSFGLWDSSLFISLRCDSCRKDNRVDPEVCVLISIKPWRSDRRSTYTVLVVLSVGRFEMVLRRNWVFELYLTIRYFKTSSNNTSFSIDVVTGRLFMVIPSWSYLFPVVLDLIPVYKISRGLTHV